MFSNDRLACGLLLLMALGCQQGTTSHGGVERSNVSTRSGIEKVSATAWKASLKAAHAPMLVAGDVFVVQKKSITALDDAGEVSSTIKLPAAPTGAMTVVSGKAFYGASKSVVAVRLEDGELLWTAKLAKVVSESPALIGDTLLATGSELVALNVDSGERRWSFRGEGDFSGAPAVSGDHVFVATSKGFIYAIDLTSGQPTWTFESTSSFGGIAAAMADGMLVVPGREGVVWGLFAETGRERWRFDTRGLISGGVATRGDRAWVGTEAGEVAAINTRTGQEVWRMEDLPAVVTVPVWSGGAVYVGCDDGKLVSLDADDGSHKWTFQLEAEPVGSPLIGDGELWVTDVGGQVYALR